MKVLDETMLRSALLDENAGTYRVGRDTLVTPLAREYLRDRGIELVFEDPDQEPAPSWRYTKDMPSMPKTPAGIGSETTFVDVETGERKTKKMEWMTHLRGNRLVPKTHPRIAFRGKLDTLQGEIIMAQAEAVELGKPGLVDDLGELLELAREMLGAEVAERAIKPLSLLGYDADGIRDVSHRIEEEFGFPHPVPDCKMGRLAACLNLLRARSREAELAAWAAFPDGKCTDIPLAMNRMSSAVYILLCKLLAGKY